MAMMKVRPNIRLPLLFPRDVEAKCCRSEISDGGPRLFTVIATSHEQLTIEVKRTIAAFVTLRTYNATTWTHLGDI